MTGIESSNCLRVSGTNGFELAADLVLVATGVEPASQLAVQAGISTGHKGAIRVYGERYEPADGESLAKLFLEIERDVLVACDPANLGEAIALDLDGRFLGRLRAQKLITRGPVSHEDIRASMRIRRTARKAIADYVTGLSGRSSEWMP